MNKATMVQRQTISLCSAMIRNVNNSFLCVSFEIRNADIVISIHLSKRSIREDELIADLMAEFESLQETSCVLKPEISVGEYYKPLKYIVYRVSHYSLIMASSVSRY